MSQNYRRKPHLYWSSSVLKTRSGKINNLGIFFHITHLKHMLCPSLEPSCRVGSVVGSQHMFSSKNKKTYL